MNGFSRYLLSTLLLLLAGIASAEIETVTWLHTDHLGSPLMARDAQGNTLWQEDYSPWGERLAVPSANSADIGYTGHYEEADIGLTYAQARWYDPAVGRFLSADPVSLHVSGVAFFGRYTYANHSPYIYWDPDGRASRSEEWAALDGGGSDPATAGARGAEMVADGAAAFGDAIEPDALSAVPGGYFLGKLRKLFKGSSPAVKNGKRNLPFGDEDRLTEVNKTLDRIDSGGPFPYKQDGLIFKNREGRLPEGSYREYTVSTPGVSNRGARRIVRETETGATYYTDDHYRNFVQIDPVKR